MTDRWEHFEHQADVGVRGIASTPAAAFALAAEAMTAIVSDLSTIRPRQKVKVTCREDDLELLLVDWLNTVIYEMATRRMLFSRFEVRLLPGGLEGVLWGEDIDRERHSPAVEPKGATFTELHVGPGVDGRWVAQCVVDV